MSYAAHFFRYCNNAILFIRIPFSLEYKNQYFLLNMIQEHRRLYTPKDVVKIYKKFLYAEFLFIISKNDG